jgi:hypothetical protein
MALQPSVGPWSLLSFLIMHTVGRTPWTWDQPVERPLSIYITETQNQRIQTSKPRVGFKPTTPVFERVKTVHALDRVTTLIGAAMKSTMCNIFTSPY